MDSNQFESHYAYQIAKEEETLLVKAREYVRLDDRFYNFRRAADMLQTVPEDALIGMMSKHWVSILTCVADIVGNASKVDYSKLHESITDSRNYLMLLDAMITEREQKEMQK